MSGRDRARPDLRTLALALAAGWMLAACAVLGGGRIEDVDVEFRGADSLSRGELHDAVAPALEDFARSEYKKSAIDDAAYDLERAHQAAGFPFARVAYEYEEAPEGRQRATFLVEEGPRTELAEVVVAGNTVFPIGVIVPFFHAPQGGFFERKRTWYVEDRVRSDAGEVEAYYVLNGYLDVEVSEPEATFDADRTRASVSIRIDEGVQYRIVAIDVEGDEALPTAALEALRSPYVGKPYYERLEVEIRGRIEERYAERGHADVEVERSRRDVEPDGSVRLAYAVVPGPRVTISAVEFRGATETRESFLRSRLELEPGDVYDRRKERESFRRLYQTGLFEKVRVGVEPDAGEERPLVVDLVESDSLELFLQPGYGSYERFRLTGGVREKNLFGTGRILRAEGTISELAQMGRAGITDPWFFGSDVVADFTVFGNRREEPAFERLELGTGVELTRRFSRHFQSGVGYQFRRSDITDIDVNDPDVQEALDDVDISSVSLSPEYDTRNNVFAPTRGVEVQAVFELADHAIGSQLDFFRVRLTTSAFFELDDDTILGTSLRTGVIAPFGLTDTIPLQERFFNGGENTVRSFGEDELGPTDSSGNPLGGEAFNVFSVELRRRVWGHFETAIFYDVGNVVPQAGDWLDSGGWGEGIGLGLRYATPVGPIRLDGAVNPDPDDGASRGAVHFSVGMAF